MRCEALRKSRWHRPEDVEIGRLRATAREAFRRMLCGVFTARDAAVSEVACKNAVDRQIRLKGSAAILTGRIFDDRGSRMTRTYGLVRFSSGSSSRAALMGFARA